jgi:hypothetical protein
VAPPRVEFSVLSCQPDADDPRRWRATWLVHNAGPDALEVEAAWIPHGRFRGDGRLPLAGQVAHDTSRELQFSVTASETPGTVVENAFLIVRVRVQRNAWRIFVRMRIEFDADAVPVPVVEAVTTQSIE